MTEGAFRILAVCTGNISRSPMVETLLRAGLDDSVQVSSAGVLGLVGRPMDPKVASHLAGQGFDTSGFASSAVSAQLLRGSNLVLALTGEHRKTLLQLLPSALLRTFTLTEFAAAVELGSGGFGSALNDSDRLRTLVRQALQARTAATRRPGFTFDIPDPFGGDEEAYRVSLTMVQQSVDQILAAVRRG